LKKYIYLIFFIFSLSLLAVGCIGSNSNQQGDASANIQSSSQNTYQDHEWSSNAAKYTSIISTDFTNISTASKNYDVYTLLTSAKYLKLHSNDAIEESDSYTVSPDLQPAKNEYREGLVDANNGALFIMLGVNYTNSGDLKSASQALNIGSNGIAASGDHFANASKFVDEYKENHGILSSESSSKVETTPTPTITSAYTGVFQYCTETIQVSPHQSSSPVIVLLSIKNKGEKNYSIAPNSWIIEMNGKIYEYYLSSDYKLSDINNGFNITPGNEGSMSIMYSVDGFVDLGSPIKLIYKGENSISDDALPCTIQSLADNSTTLGQIVTTGIPITGIEHSSIQKP
jgi:hypothetical protein